MQIVCVEDKIVLSPADQHRQAAEPVKVFVQEMNQLVARIGPRRWEYRARTSGWQDGCASSCTVRPVQREPRGAIGWRDAISSAARTKRFAPRTAGWARFRVLRRILNRHGNFLPFGGGKAAVLKRTRRPICSGRLKAVARPIAPPQSWSTSVSFFLQVEPRDKTCPGHRHGFSVDSRTGRGPGLSDRPQPM